MYANHKSPLTAVSTLFLWEIKARSDSLCRLLSNLESLCRLCCQILEDCEPCAGCLRFNRSDLPSTSTEFSQ